MIATFIANPHFLEDLNADGATRLAMLEFANRALDFARVISPSKTFSDRLSVQEDGDKVAMVSNWSLWAIVEFGSVNNPPYAPIRLGVEAAGLHFVDDGR